MQEKGDGGCVPGGVRGLRGHSHVALGSRPPAPPGPQMGPNAKELFRLVEDFVDVIGFRMKDLRDAYQVTDNLGEPRPLPRSPGPALQPRGP